MKYFVGIDDTDNKNSRGTGYRARKMSELLVENNIADVYTVSRHQLFFNPQIPYTSKNSSACLCLETSEKEKLIEFCREFLIEDSAEGSDVGLCVIKYNDVTKDLIKYSRDAKIKVLTRDDIKRVKQTTDFYLEGLTGTKDGIIGALAATGLRRYGNDGRCIWLKGKSLREAGGIYTAKEMYELFYIDNICDMENLQLDNNSRIFVDDWLRPLIIDNKITVVTEKIKAEEYEYRIPPKDYIKNISN